MLQTSRYLPVHCAKGAELASFTVHLWSSLDSLLVCWSLVQIQRTAQNLVDLLQFAGFSVDGQRSETSELNINITKV